jgi:protein LTV1
MPILTTFPRSPSPTCYASPHAFRISHARVPHTCHDPAFHAHAPRPAPLTPPQARRAEKKSHKETFGDERRRQLKTQAKSVGGGKAADLTVGSRGVVSLS